MKRIWTPKVKLEIVCDLFFTDRTVMIVWLVEIHVNLIDGKLISTLAERTENGSDEWRFIGMMPDNSFEFKQTTSTSVENHSIQRSYEKWMTIRQRTTVKIYYWYQLEWKVDSLK